MKIAIPVEEDRRSVCVSFGRAPYFLFQDTDTQIVEVLENPAAQAEGGAGLKAAQFVVDQNANAVVTVRCGENAAQVLQAANIQILKASGTDSKTNLAAYKENRLAQLTHFHAGFHGVQ